MNPGFEDLSKRSLLARFIKLHPEIQDIIDGSESASSSSEVSSTDDSLIVSQASYDKKVADLDELNKEKIPANSQAIEAARELEIFVKMPNIKWQKMSRKFSSPASLNCKLILCVQNRLISMMPPLTL